MRFLVVEDRLENQKAAKNFFTSIGVEVEFASTFEEGEQKLDNEVESYHAAIIDLELPVPGGCVEKVGFALAEKAHTYGLPCVVLTAGPYHHGETSLVFDEDEIELKRGPAKDTPAAYQVAFDVLCDLCPLANMEEIFVSRKRYEEAVGRQ